MPNKDKRVSLYFPTGGLVTGTAFQKQPPYTTHSCQNVRPIESLTGRERGGSRPGLSKLSATQLGTGAPVVMLGELPIYYTKDKPAVP